MTRPTGSAALAFLLAAPLGAQATRASIGLPGWSQPFTIESVATPAVTLDAPYDKAYAAIKAAFGDLKVQTVVDDPTHGIVGDQNAHAFVSYADQRASRLLDCGQNSMGASNADTYRLTIVFLALVDKQDDTHTKVQVGFVAGAVPPTAGLSDGLQCGSKGVLEEKLVQLANKRLK
jgi:hypothetical protein